MSPPSVGRIVDQLRQRAGVRVIDLGPLVGMSPSWGQRVLDGSLCPDLPAADRLASALGARNGERLALLEAVSRVKLERAGIVETDLDQVVAVLLRIYRRKS